MSTAVAGKPKTPAAPAKRTKLTWPVVLLLIALALVLFAAVGAATGNHGLTSSGQIGAALASAVPIAMAGLGGLWSERAGVVNIGLEGMMVAGTFCGAWGGFLVNPWVGLLAGMAGGALGGLLHALVTVTFGVDHIVSGVGINLLIPGICAYVNRIYYKDYVADGAGANQSPPADSLPTFTVPGLSDWLGDIEKHHWFLVSDVAGVVRGLVTDLSVVTLIAAAFLVASYFLLWRTVFGLRLRSCGENPTAAESLGVNVYTYKYLAVVSSGAFAGLGGAYLSLVAAHFYRDGQTQGRGFIGLAAMIFGNWMPGGLAAGAGLFGFTDSLQLRDADSVHVLLLVVAIAMALLAVWQFYRRKLTAGLISTVVAGGVATWYACTDEVQRPLIVATPYVITLVVLALASQRLRMPKADGQVYRKGQAK
ncbi:MULTISPECIES: ABC transporter permease [Kitasatospora]|uniref:Putative ABC transporter permease protein n=1 Tax=Kitasatospora setae (strain ATCC 33774 / DSM 43861 / JCM 3304 / KCC A-0304 / NBRC 14216 / KM-6054) TaxID=452652 RepID=E4NCA9_KITSK|nr:MULTISPECIES: ABC transporter permease [Kitasatospora]BAJ28840.1 putative ABC transporter permease protein [Kitasatospora setae KM-6054]